MKRGAAAVAAVAAAASAAGAGAAFAGGGHESAVQEGKNRMIARALGPAEAVQAQAAARLRLQPPRPSSPPPAHPGVVGSQQSLGGIPVPFSPALFAPTNQWQAQRHGRDVAVYAGALTRQPARGLLIVVTENVTTGAQAARAYHPPGTTGALTITTVTSHGDVHYTAAHGRRGVVNLAAVSPPAR